MFKFVTIYRKVDDEEALEAFFARTHLPLAEQLPGLIKSEVTRVAGKPGGESRFHLLYALTFESQIAFRRAVASEPGLLLIQALKPWDEAGIITWFFGTGYEEMAPDEVRFGPGEA
ncbi:MAG: EthD family reductase [Candidatus Promineifilaceae bacterium]|nr:EthD family reductase [Candidatus Promineifilaceae bacterium]